MRTIRRNGFRWRGCLCLILLACLQTACVSIRPVVKIGLLAPFEGLYRRTGYTALAAMRAAIAETPVIGVDILPLALDDGNDPQRARRSAQQLLADASVQAVVGPVTPETFFSVLALLPTSQPSWLAPFAVLPETGQIGDPRADTAWATDLVSAVAQAARHQHAQRLVLAGWTPGWPQFSAEAWTKLIGMPVLITDEGNAIAKTDAVFWLGNPVGAALYLANLRAVYPSVPFWLGPQGGDPVFVERVKSRGPVYWATWLGADYDQWATQHPDLATPAAYLVYQATRRSIGRLTNQTPLPEPAWRIQLFIIDEAGQSHPRPE